MFPGVDNDITHLPGPIAYSVMDAGQSVYFNSNSFRTKDIETPRILNRISGRTGKKKMNCHHSSFHLNSDSTNDEDCSEQWHTSVKNLFELKQVNVEVLEFSFRGL